LAFAPDGTLWASGREHDADNKDVVPHHILRQYGTDGTLVRTLLSTATFPSRQLPPGIEGFLISGPDRMGFYSRPTNEYFEYTLKGQLLKRWKISAFPANTLIQGAAMPSDTLYLTGMDSSSTLFLYQFDRSSGAFGPVSFGQPSDTKGIRMVMILGSDADRLVLYGKNNLSWYRVE
jgi:hypothetical protein